jgi:DNA-binding HxlR family transcriptional regulator
MDQTNRNVRGPDPAHPDCKAVTETLARIGDKWTVMVIGALSQGGCATPRSGRSSGISQLH